MGRWSLLAMLWLPVFGCTPGAMVEVEQPKPPAPAPPANRIEIASLKFSDKDLERRFLRFDKVAREYAGRDFEHRPYQLGGNFVRAVWARGIGFEEPAAFRGTRDQFKDIHRI